MTEFASFFFSVGRNGACRHRKPVAFSLLYQRNRVCRYFLCKCRCVNPSQAPEGPDESRKVNSGCSSSNLANSDCMVVAATGEDYGLK